MSYRLTNILFLGFLLILSLWYFMQSLEFVVEAEDFILNAGFYPLLLSSFLIILCLIKLIQTFVKGEKEEQFKVSNLKYIFITVVLLVAYMFLWSAFRNFFYLFTFLFLLSLTMVYAEKQYRKNIKIILRNIAVSAFVTLLIYLIFDLVFSIRF